MSWRLVSSPSSVVAGIFGTTLRYPGPPRVTPGPTVAAARAGVDTLTAWRPAGSGYRARMSAHSTEELEAIQGVTDRVTSWQDGATEGTVEEELRKGLDQAGVQLGDDDVTTLATAIEERHGAVNAAEVLGS